VQTQSHSGITPEHLRCCLRYLIDNGYTFVSLQDVIQALTDQTALPEKAVTFTMDDGFLDQGEIAAPIFLEFECPLTFFVITGLLDKTLWPWDAQISWIIDKTEDENIEITFADEFLHIKLGDAAKRRLARETIRNTLKEMDAEVVQEYLLKLAEVAGVSIPEFAPSNFQPLDWQHARELESKGIRFAPHSMTHRILSKLSRKTAEEEIIGSWEKLKKELSDPLKVFCYPTGRVLDFGSREIDILKKNGFLAATSTEHGYVETKSNTDEQLYRLPRFELPDNMEDFIQYCSWMEHAKTKFKQVATLS